MKALLRGSNLHKEATLHWENVVKAISAEIWFERNQIETKFGRSCLFFQTSVQELGVWEGISTLLEGTREISSRKINKGNEKI